MPRLILGCLFALVDIIYMIDNLSISIGYESIGDQLAKESSFRLTFGEPSFCVLQIRLERQLVSRIMIGSKQRTSDVLFFESCRVPLIRALFCVIGTEQAFSADALRTNYTGTEFLHREFC